MRQEHIQITYASKLIIVTTTVTRKFNIDIDCCPLNLFVQMEAIKCHVIDKSNSVYLTVKLWSTERDHLAYFAMEVWNALTSLQLSIFNIDVR